MEDCPSDDERLLLEALGPHHDAIEQNDVPDNASESGSPKSGLELPNEFPDKYLEPISVASKAGFFCEDLDLESGLSLESVQPGDGGCELESVRLASSQDMQIGRQGWIVAVGLEGGRRR